MDPRPKEAAEGAGGDAARAADAERQRDEGRHSRPRGAHCTCNAVELGAEDLAARGGADGLPIMSCEPGAGVDAAQPVEYRCCSALGAGRASIASIS